MRWLFLAWDCQGEPIVEITVTIPIVVIVLLASTNSGFVPGLRYCDQGEKNI